MPDDDRLDSPADRQVGELLGRVAADAARLSRPVGVDRIRVLAARRRGRRAIASVVAAVVVSVGTIAVIATSARDRQIQPAGPPSPTAGISAAATTTITASSPLSGGPHR
ncbi:hypothetical protein [Amycolatopsis sp. NPDC003861]